MSKSLFYFVISLLFSGCVQQTGHMKKEQSDFITIDFEQCYNTEQQMMISEIADQVEYIELKTPNDIIISRIMDVIHFDDYLIIKSRSIVYLFHKNGDFICQVGSRGQGPGEYDYVYSVEFDFHKKEIIISDYFQLLFYDLEGKFLRNRNVRSLELGLSDSILWMAEIISTANRQKFLAFASLLDGEGDSIAYIQNTLYGVINSERQSYISYPYTSFFYHKNNVLYFKGDTSNDTIWEISGLNTRPHAFINMGKFKLPWEHEAWISRDEFDRNREKYRMVPSIVEDDNYFYLYTRSRNSIDRIPVDLKYIVYDKTKKRGFSAKDNQYIGLTDDILGGPPLWPFWISDEYYINAIESFELLEKVKTGIYSPSHSLKELLSRIGEDTNQLLILCHKKMFNK